MLDLQCIQKENLLEEMSRNYPGKVLFIPADVTKSNELDVAFKKTINTFKNLDIVINSAGIIDEINWKHCINVNLVKKNESPFNSFQNKIALDRKYGSILLSFGIYAKIFIW